VRNAFGQPQSILVLGGTSDIALAVVRRLIDARTSTVVLAGRDEAALARSADELRAHGASTVATITFDATDPASAAPVIEQAFETAGGPVDLVLMAVGLLGDQTASDDDAALTAKMLTVNLTWPAAALTALRPRLLAQGAGHVAVFSSVAGIRVRRANFTYGSAKAGLDAFALGFAESVRPQGIKVQVIRPGFVRTKMTEGRPEAPFTTDVDEAADTIVKGLGGSSRVIWSPPVLQAVYLVLRHLPAIIWRRLPG
jgi:decaprenylphospho-beta-D-erythro-pentofuranosid-2-ulose 2-reductase